ncbi:MAG: DUF3467 domain-containing protein [Chloroflexi bacterium]|nr:DUF3467 domain-containing protein [Chloroflexota bacterium]
MAKKNEATDRDGVSVRLYWESGDDLPTLYTNHLLVSHSTGSEFFIYFGQLAAPALMPGEIPEELAIKPVAKIVLSHESLRRFVDVLEGNLSKFESLMKEDKDGN